MTTAIYNRAFWNLIRGQHVDHAELASKKVCYGTYLAPEEFKGKFDTALAKECVFRRLATVVRATSSEGKIQAVESTGAAAWVNEHASIPESADTVTQFAFSSFKLASMVRLKTVFVTDTAFPLENYLQGAFARRFGRAEEAAFLNGSGVDRPSGLLGETGASLGAAAASATAITYDEVVNLYFSLKAEHRANAVFLMHDDTAMALRVLKDTAGNPLWNAERETIFGKPVITSPAIPTMAAGKKAIVFGDLAQYWIIERQPLSVKRLDELYSVHDEIGFSASERLDGKLISPDAIKVLQMAG